MKMTGFILTTATLLASVAFASSGELEFAQPAEDSIVGWEQQSFPLGNGWFGVNGFGIVTNDRFQVTENSVLTICHRGPNLTNALEIRLETDHHGYTDYKRELDIEVASSSPNGEGYRSLFDGVLDTLGGFEGWFERHHPEGFFEMSFPKFVPEFSELTVYGLGIDGMKVKIREGGDWKELVPVSTEKGEYSLKYVFDRKYTTVKLRIEFPPVKRIELYEIELPGAVRETKAARTDEPLKKKRLISG